MTTHMENSFSGPSSMAEPDEEREDIEMDACMRAKVLMVGAGGIGCELLKNLALSGFGNITVVDLDTIETSNLNRQFLFRRAHVGKSKAIVARDAVVSQQGERGASFPLEVIAHHANIREPKFGVSFFSSFSIVLNALDNLDARRHVNRMCLAAGVPLVESGSTGYNGQVSVHWKTMNTECFECKPKQMPKSYPVCTIRNTPDKPVHCVVWAKDMLFSRLFGEIEGNDLDDGGEDDSVGRRTLHEGTSTADTSTSFSWERQLGEDAEDYGMRIAIRVFDSDIYRLNQIEELWTSRTPPCPLNIKAFSSNDRKDFACISDAMRSAKSPNGRASWQAAGLQERNVWNFVENLCLFVRSIADYVELRKDTLGKAIFDKEDDLAVDFVSSASNLRMLNYGIEAQSRFQVKSIAGNIIAAVATTNAVVAGLIVVEAKKVLCLAEAEAAKLCRMVWVRRQASGKKLMVEEALEQSSESCFVCAKSIIRLRCDVNQRTLHDLVEVFLKQKLGMVEPSLYLGSTMTGLYEEGDDLDEEDVEQYARLLRRPLSQLPGGGVHHDVTLAVQDNATSLRCELLVEHVDGFGVEPSAKEVSDKTPAVELFTLSGTIGTEGEKGLSQENAPGVRTGSGKRKAEEEAEVDASDEDCVFAE